MNAFERTNLWRATLGRRADDENAEAREKLRQSYLVFRDRAGDVLKQIAKDVPNLTIHDLTHVDALWEIANLIVGPTVNFTPAEAYVLGGAFLLHDAAMTVVAFPGGLKELQSTVEWGDAIIASLITREIEVTPERIISPPRDVLNEALLSTLRLFHARQAADLPRMSWIKPDTGEQLWLIDDEALRNYYGPHIGKIASSHWSDAYHLANELVPLITAGPGVPSDWVVNPLKIACLLRVSDAAHLDYRRAPSLLMALHGPGPGSLKYWTFQNRLGKPSLQHDAIVYSGGEFTINDVDAWWGCFEALRLLDLELKRVDAVLQDNGLPRLIAKRVAGVEGPDFLKRYIPTKGWTPIDASVKVTEVRRVVEMFGGSKLYGDNPLVPIRELIQNAADAIRAKQVLRRMPTSFGRIEVQLHQEEDGWWLDVLDNGVGMSSRVLTQVLLDFGSRFWTGPVVREEMPGLLGKGMQARGSFGIGFFSVFMLGDKVRVTTWKDGSAAQDACTLEFREGVGSRPILREPLLLESLSEPGTRVSILLRNVPHEPKGLLWAGENWEGKPILRDFGAAVASIAPTLDVSLEVVYGTGRSVVVRESDWMEIAGNDLLNRISQKSEKMQRAATMLRPLRDSEGNIFGRAALDWETFIFFQERGIVTVDGLRATEVQHLTGILVGKVPENLARDSAFPSVPLPVLSQWATEQGRLFLQASSSNRLDSSKSNQRILLTIAALVLKCGGDIGELPIVMLDNDGLSRKSFCSYIANLGEFFLLEGDVEYDEDVDEVHPRQFAESFSFASDLLRVSKESPVMLRIGNIAWPEYLLESGRPRTLLELVWKEVKEVWGDFEVEETEMEVGEVESEPIRRTAMRVIRSNQEVNGS